MKYQRAWAEINLSHLSYNLAAVRMLTGNTNIMGIVKADGYGHGAVPVANTLIAQGVRSLGVAMCEEGVALRENGITVPILVMGFTPEPLLPYMLENNLIQTVFSKDGAEILAIHAARLNKRAAVHIKIDTGMSRLGFMPNEESISEICDIAENPNLHIAGIYTHFATSDALENEFMYEQYACFAWVLDELQKRGLNIPMKHSANSGAISQALRDKYIENLFLDAVRPGILLYGHPPSEEMAETCKSLALKPVMRLMTQISMVKNLPEGVGISYGHIYKTLRPSKIAVLPVGYADGYPRRLSHRGKVFVNGKYAPIAGAICMDQCMVDVTDIPNVKSGDPVVMLDEINISAENLASTVGTISYEILCCIGKRVPRVYISE
ncbi:MAG: alanine racemase [Clostridiales bacterium]|jgi:alanine racemase|nr:alanine racemase [Clostridiales bacterium]